MNLEEDPPLSESRRRKRKMKEGGYTCDKCEYFATKATLFTEHIKNNHTGVKYPCDKCEFSATTEYSLKKHSESKHETVRYFCN